MTSIDHLGILCHCLCLLSKTKGWFQILLLLTISLYELGRWSVCNPLSLGNCSLAKSWSCMGLILRLSFLKEIRLLRHVRWSLFIVITLIWLIELIYWSWKCRIFWSLLSNRGFLELKSTSRSHCLLSHLLWLLYWFLKSKACLSSKSRIFCRGFRRLFSISKTHG